MKSDEMMILPKLYQIFQYIIDCEEHKFFMSNSMLGSVSDEKVVPINSKFKKEWNPSTCFYS